MSKSLNAKSGPQVLSMEAAVLEAIEPLIKLVDENPRRWNDEKGESDTGHEQRSQGDMGLRILLSQLCLTVHRQLKGVLNTRTGQKIDNAIERVKRSQDILSSFEKRYSGDVDAMFADPDYLVQMHWFQVNVEREKMLGQFLDAFQGAYEVVTKGEKWVPLTQEELAAQRGQRTADLRISDEEKNRLLALRERAMAKSA